MISKQETLDFLNAMIKKVQEMPREERERLSRELNDYVLEYYGNKTIEETIYKLDESACRDKKERYEIDNDILLIA